MTTTKPLADQTPVEIDTRLAELYREAGHADNNLRAAIEMAHHAVDDTQRHISRNRKEWAMSNADAVAKAREIADPEARYTGMRGPSPYSAHRAITRYDAAKAEVARILELTKPLNDEFVRRGGWSRFFVVQNNNGHIHSSMNCQTCNRNGIPTAFGWTPQLSGKTEAEAVAELGPTMCTVCFPSAPVEWTMGKQQTAEEAAADGKCLNRKAANLKRYGMSLAGDCDVCGARGVGATDAGLRKHTHQRMLDEAAAKARREDPKLIGAPDGGVLKVGSDVVKTVRAAEIAYVDRQWWIKYSEVQRPDAPGMADEDREKAQQLIEALAAKFGASVEEQVARLASRVARKLKDFQ